MTVHASQIEVAKNATSVPTKTRRAGAYSLGLKRLFDLTLVVLALPFVIPFLAIISVFIAFDGHSPLFRQERIGRDGKRFKIWKFRTMVVDAEAHLSRYLDENPEAKLEWETKQKLSHDPRCTKVGRILRKTSVDELPQLFNVLTGDMSLIGPRPMMPEQQAMYPGQAYYKMRPGMTGAWQVTTRNMSSFADRANYDDGYYRDISFLNDLKILGQTVGVVLRGTGV